MNKISWKDDSEFTRFCNALLSFEISKQVVPFEAPGPDGGIDGSYTGTYDGRTGRWRFQYKFRTTARQQAFSSLKAGLPKELKSLNDETHFILLTNIDLLPNERVQLLDIAASCKPNIIADVWDGAKLQALSLNYPILRLWAEQGFTTAQLQHYQDFFKHRLTSTIDEPDTLANEFAARDQQLAELNTFIGSSVKKIAVLSGEAGIGKTRLAIEFFKATIDPLERWQALVLATHTPDFDRLMLALSGNINTVILVEDAHNLTPDVLADLRRIMLSAYGANVKIILTGRKLWLDQALRFLPRLEQTATIEFIDVPYLTSDETFALFNQQVKHPHYRNYLKDLAFISRGRPILIVALLRAIHRNVPIMESKSDAALYNYVESYFTDIIRLTATESQTSLPNLKRLLQLLCLLEPINLRVEQTVATLAARQSVPVETLRDFVERLVKDNLALQKPNFVITPDYYSDIMLTTASDNFVMDAIREFPEYLPNIIRNLSAAEQSFDASQKDKLGLERILSRYIENVATASYPDMQQMFQVIASITFHKPAFAVQAVEGLLQRLDGVNDETFWRRLVDDMNARSNFGASFYNSIGRTLSDLMYTQQHEQFVLNAVFTFFNHLSDDSLFKLTFALRKQNFVGRYNFRQQELFIRVAMDRYAQHESFALFVVRCFHDFLQLEVRTSSMDPLKPSQINIVTYYLPADPKVVQLRKQVIDGLMTIYKTVDTPTVRLAVLNELLDVPRAISASRRSTSPYNNPIEVLEILDFIEAVKDSFSLEMRRKATERLYYMTRWNDSVLLDRINDLSGKLQPRNLDERLIDMLTNPQIRGNAHYEELIERIKKSSLEMVETSSAPEIAHALHHSLTATKGHTEFIGIFNTALHDTDADKTREVYEILQLMDSEYLYQYGSYFLRALRFRHQDISFFWSKMQRLEATEDARSVNVALHVYAFLKETINDEDVDFIKRVFPMRLALPDIGNNLAMAIATVLKFYPAAGKALATDFFDTANERQLETFFLATEDGQNPEILKELIVNHTLRHDLVFGIQQAMMKLTAADVITQTDLLDYFLSRFALKQKFSQGEKWIPYDFVPVENYGLFSSWTDADRLQFFLRVLDWYVNASLNDIDGYNGKDLLEFVQPGKVLTPELLTHYLEITNTTEEIKKHQRLMASLANFESKSMELMTAVVAILHKADQRNADEWKKLTTEGYIAITSLGVKMGSANEPFADDVNLLALIRQALVRYGNYAVAGPFLRSIETHLQAELNNFVDPDDSW